MILEGVMGGARAGMSRAEIRDALGAPDGWGCGPAPDDVEAAWIWQYGKFEVHFGDPSPDLSWMLFTDYVDPLDAGEGRTVDPWIMSGKPTFALTVQRLGALDVPFTRWRWTSGERVLRLDNGVELTFRTLAKGAAWAAITVPSPDRGAAMRWRLVADP
jgi:hypothetical protein